MSSDESSSEAENDVLESIRVYPKGENEEDAVVVNATLLGDGGMDESDQGEMSNRESFSDDDVDATMEEDDEDSSVACAVVVSAEVENDMSLKQSTKVRHKKEDKNTEDNTAATNSAKIRKRKRYSEQKETGIPSFKDLGIPFRAIKRIMKIDPDIATVQNEAAMVTTYALELFIKKIVNESYLNAKKRGRNTVKYEDLGEARAANQNLNFLDTLLP